MTSDVPANTEMTVDEDFQYAVRLHQEGRLAGAVELYRRLLDVAPGHPDALHLFGMALHQLGQSENGIRQIEQAIRVRPDFAGFHNNLGNIHASLGQVEHARDNYLRATALDPALADSHNNLGVLYRMTGANDLAESEYWCAINLDPSHYRAYNNLGMLEAARGNIELAVRHYCTSITLSPRQDDGHKLLGTALYSLGRIEEAAEVYRQWLEKDPSSPVARHHLAACSGADIPDRAPDDYVEHLFDRFAESFEEQLQTRLSYRAPELVATALSRTLPAAATQFDVLDVGCGTGLCGPLLRPWAAQLTGVDLSVGMLQQAEAKGCYDQLYKIELTEFLNRAEQAGNWDLIISADTLCYFGPLEGVLAAASHALRPAGWLAFSVEDAGELAAQPGYRLNPHGRFAHTHAYPQRTLIESGFEVASIDSVTLRTEGGKPVLGWVVVGRPVQSAQTQGSS